jgi:hypothetical protein
MDLSDEFKGVVLVDIRDKKDFIGDPEVDESPCEPGNEIRNVFRFVSYRYHNG